MSEAKTITGLTCPNCSSPFSIPEGARVVTCPACQMRHLVAGERGVYRYQVQRAIDRAAAQRAVQGFWTGINKAMDLSSSARIQELFLAYLPYWYGRAHMAGWMFGRVKRGKDKTKPAEVMISEMVAWNDAACDVAEFGVQTAPVHDSDLAAYDGDALRADGSVFEPTESRSEALEQAQAAFVKKGQSRGKLVKRFFERFLFLREQLALVYYPLWVSRYTYKQRTYQVVVDGQHGQVLYGKAPGNLLYRAAMLALGMGLGALSMVNGTLLSLVILANSHSDDAPWWLVLVALAAGVALVGWGYAAFRYGEEIEVGGVKKSSGDELAGAFDKVIQLGSWVQD
jgi:DNA-directed RNA polymerase subunit RPC12/RpoP